MPAHLMGQFPFQNPTNISSGSSNHLASAATLKSIKSYIYLLMISSDSHSSIISGSLPGTWIIIDEEQQHAVIMLVNPCQEILWGQHQKRMVFPVLPSIWSPPDHQWWHWPDPNDRSPGAGETFSENFDIQLKLHLPFNEDVESISCKIWRVNPKFEAAESYALG